jgi:hypothetical protein
VDVSAQRFQCRAQWFRLHAATVEVLDESRYSTVCFVALTLQNDR